MESEGEDNISKAKKEKVIKNRKEMNKRMIYGEKKNN